MPPSGSETVRPTFPDGHRRSAESESGVALSGVTLPLCFRQTSQLPSQLFLWSVVIFETRLVKFTACRAAAAPAMTQLTVQWTDKSHHSWPAGRTLVLF